MDQEISNSLYKNTGCLYVGFTPIGNLGDISKRLISTIEKCDLIACEDTRVTGILLNFLKIKKQTISYREENEERQTTLLIEKIKIGFKILLVSDAGAPGLSDPGFKIIRECRRNYLTVIPIPGPSAFLSALCASGLPMNSFLFIGFLRPKKSARKVFFKDYKDFLYTIILYESSHRIDKFLIDLMDELGNSRIICIAREITKLYETFLVGQINEVIERFNKKSKKGEFVIIIASKSYKL